MQNRIANTSSYRNFQSLNEINAQVRTDPAGFVEHCEALYNHTIDDVARHILTTTRSVVLLAGPSGSGKTTTAKRLAEAMERDGVETHTVELDDYFLPLDRSDLSIDWESPDRVDLPLLSAHLDALGRGEEIELPRFDFKTGTRLPSEKSIRLGRDEVVIFEGIHALNSAIYTKTSCHPITIYISARMRIRDETHVIFRPDWIRFLRRGLRDSLFRNTTLSHPLARWPDVRRGEKAYIMPFKTRAQIMIDTAFDYEVNLLAPLMQEAVSSLDRTALGELRMARLPDAMSLFAPLSPSCVPASSILREFMGGLGLPDAAEDAR